MRTELTEEQIKDYIENYGDGDVYCAHRITREGLLEIDFMPCLANFVDESSITKTVEWINKKLELRKEYVKTIVVSDKFAYIPTSARSNHYALVKNFDKFMTRVRKQNKKKNQPTRVEYCR